MSYTGEWTRVVADYEGRPFFGPNSLCFASNGTLFFTDSGPMGDTSLASPKVSARVFVRILRVHACSVWGIMGGLSLARRVHVSFHVYIHMHIRIQAYILAHGHTCT
jgi:hypothetical protein